MIAELYEIRCCVWGWIKDQEDFSDFPSGFCNSKHNGSGCGEGFKFVNEHCHYKFSHFFLERTEFTMIFFRLLTLSLFLHKFA